MVNRLAWNIYCQMASPTHSVAVNYSTTITTTICLTGLFFHSRPVTKLKKIVWKLLVQEHPTNTVRTLKEITELHILYTVIQCLMLTVRDGRTCTYRPVTYVHTYMYVHTCMYVRTCTYRPVMQQNTSQVVIVSSAQDWVWAGAVQRWGWRGTVFSQTPVLPPCKLCLGSTMQIVLELLRSYIFWRSTVDTFQGPGPRKFRLELHASLTLVWSWVMLVGCMLHATELIKCSHTKQKQCTDASLLLHAWILLVNLWCVGMNTDDCTLHSVQTANSAQLDKCSIKNLKYFNQDWYIRKKKWCHAKTLWSLAEKLL